MTARSFERGFCIVMCGFGAVFSWIMILAWVIFGLPFALLSRVLKRRHRVSTTAEPLIIAYTNLLHKHQNVDAKEIHEFLEQYKHDKEFIQIAHTLNVLFIALRRNDGDKRTVKCWHCNGEVQILEDGWICRQCSQHGRPFDKPAMTVGEGCSENKPWQA